MSIEHLREQMGDYAKDVNINLSKVLSEEGAPDLSKNQIFGVALACAYTAGNRQIVQSIQQEASSFLSAAEMHAARAASTIMAMNNIYYRFIHHMQDQEYAKLPANLRMQIIANPGIAKVDFELYCLAVSVLNGCGMCMEAHVQTATKAGISRLGIQSVIRIAAVLNSAAQSLAIAHIV